MYEFLGAIAGRSIMLEGEINRRSITATFISFALLQLSVLWTKEDSLVYLFVGFKFILVWLVMSSILGCLKIAFDGFRVIVDTDPRTRAWMDGPHLSPWMRAVRDITSCIFGVYVPLDPTYKRIIENGIGWNGLMVSFITLCIALTASEAIQDQKRLSTQAPGVNSTPKKSD